MAGMRRILQLSAGPPHFDPESQFLLARSFLSAEDGEVDEKQARYWLRLAGEQGHEQAKTELLKLTLPPGAGHDDDIKMDDVDAKEDEADQAHDSDNVERDEHGMVKRRDMSGEFIKAREVAKMLVTEDLLVRVRSLATFVLENAHRPEFVKLVFVAMPYRCVDALSRHVPLPGTESVPWQQLLTHEVLNACMKRTEAMVRKEALPLVPPGADPRSGALDVDGLDRRGRAQPTASPTLSHVGTLPIDWIPVFDPISGRLNPSFRRRDLTPEEMRHAVGPDPASCLHCPAVGEPSLVTTKSQFLRNLESFTTFKPSELGLNKSTMLMGGSVLAALLPLPPSLQTLNSDMDVYDGALKHMFRRPLPTDLRSMVVEYLQADINKQFVQFAKVTSCSRKWTRRWRSSLSSYNPVYYSSPAWHDSDIDVFVSCASDKDAREKSVKLIKKAMASDPEYVGRYFVRTSTALTAVCMTDVRNIQVIAVPGRSPRDMLMDFDLDCASFAFDGRNVWALPRARRAVNTRANFIDPFVMRYARNRQRLGKYDLRGFRMVLFEACKHSPRCDVVLDTETRGWWDLAVRAVVMCKHRQKPDKKDGITRNIDTLVPTPANRKALLEQQEDMEKSSEGLDKHVDEPPLSTALPRPQFRVDKGIARGDGKVYEDGTVPVYAGHMDVILNRMRELEIIERLKFNENCLPGEVYQPRFEHNAHLDRMYQVRLTASKRPRIGHNPERLLNTCYQCKGWVKRGEFSDKLCRRCQQLSEHYLKAKPDLSHKVFIVTGGRIKLGYACALRLLRCGAVVAVTTRFPAIARETYAKEEDSAEWLHRLHVYGVDFRSLPAVTRFAVEFKSEFDRLDGLINNAAQTVRRPPAYYARLVEREQRLALEEGDGEDMRADMALVSQQRVGSLSSSMQNLVALNFMHMTGAGSGTVARTGNGSWSAVATQVPVLPSDRHTPEEAAQLFPVGETDAHGEQLDRRPDTTWNATMHQVHPLEVLECQLVNVTAPFTLITALEPLLRKRHNSLYVKNPGRHFVINVSSTEGQFDTSLPKKAVHPHTNMCKSALNMLTRSIAMDMARDEVFVMSVDPGWVSDMRPTTWRDDSDPDNVLDRDRAVKVRPPLSVDEGAARVLQPILSYIPFDTRVPAMGVLLKDYRVVSW